MRGAVATLPSLLLMACAAQPLPPEGQARVYRGAVAFVQAHAIAEGCESLVLDEAAIAAAAENLMAELGAPYTRRDVEAYLRALPEGSIGRAAAAQLEAKGVVLDDLRQPAPDPALCALGTRERARETIVGRFLVDEA